MKTHSSFLWFIGAILPLSLLTLSPAGLPAADAAQVFATPEAAVSALSQAVSTTNRAALISLFGSASEQLVNPDEVQSAAELAEFSAAFSVTNRLVSESDARMVLEIGAQGWPFPIPIVKIATGWQFDTRAGVDELLNRRIGNNELDVLKVMRAMVEAQREYASRDRDGDEVLEYAQKIASSPAQMDGLFWPTELNGEISPLGPLVAYAASEGYSRKTSATSSGRQAFHGYFFKMLTRQGKRAPGGKYDYVINGNMIGGFGFVAWPAEYGDSGIMTFIVNQQGCVYQRDLGPKTSNFVERMKEYDRDPAWQASPD